MKTTFKVITTLADSDPKLVLARRFPDTLSADDASSLWAFSLAIGLFQFGIVFIF
jgi:hypothetical protein